MRLDGLCLCEAPIFYMDFSVFSSLSLHCHVIWRGRENKHKRLEVQRTPSTFVFDAMYFILWHSFSALLLFNSLSTSFALFRSPFLFVFAWILAHPRIASSHFCYIYRTYTRSQSMARYSTHFEVLYPPMEQHRKKGNINTQCCGLSVFGVLHDCFLW